MEKKSAGRRAKFANAGATMPRREPASAVRLSRRHDCGLFRRDAGRRDACADGAFRPRPTDCPKPRLPQTGRASFRPKRTKPSLSSEPFLSCSHRAGRHGPFRHADGRRDPTDRRHVLRARAQRATGPRNLQAIPLPEACRRARPKVAPERR